MSPPGPLKLPVRPVPWPGGDGVGRGSAPPLVGRLVLREARYQERMESLLEITQAATSSLELSQILGLAVERVGKVLGADRCSVVLVEAVLSPRSDLIGRTLRETRFRERYGCTPREVRAGPR